jgi:flagellar basal body-associated protein FliL
MGKKILKISLITLGILLLLAIVLPFMFKGKIIAKVQEEANKNYNKIIKNIAKETVIEKEKCLVSLS